MINYLNFFTFETKLALFDISPNNSDDVNFNYFFNIKFCLSLTTEKFELTKLRICASVFCLLLTKTRWFAFTFIQWAICHARHGTISPVASTPTTPTRFPAADERSIVYTARESHVAILKKKIRGRERDDDNKIRGDFINCCSCFLCYDLMAIKNKFDMSEREKRRSVFGESISSV